MKRPYIIIVCSQCGNDFDKDRREYNRQVRKGNTRFFCNLSCSASFSCKASPRRGNAKNFGDNAIIRKKDELSSFRLYVRLCRKRTKYDTSITPEYLKELWEIQGAKCALSGIDLHLNEGVGRSDLRWTASLDRVDSQVGYVSGNVQFVSTALNLAKSTMSNDDMIEFLRLIRGK